MLSHFSDLYIMIINLFILNSLRNTINELCMLLKIQTTMCPFSNVEYAITSVCLFFHIFRTCKLIIIIFNVFGIFKLLDIFLFLMCFIIF